MDSDTPTWIIAGDELKAGKLIKPGRMKNGSEQRIYLSKQAAALFNEALKSCRVGDYVFPADSNRVKEGITTRLPHLHGESVTKAVRRLTGEEGITTHDLRRAVGKYLKNAGYGKEIRDLMLSHKDNSVDAIHYTADAKMEAQCREAWQAWADHVMKLVETGRAA